MRDRMSPSRPAQGADVIARAVDARRAAVRGVTGTAFPL